jgi:uncharacterized iron-regulated membrane protein
VRGVWTLRLKTKPYTLVRDLHTVPGFYISLLALIIFVTGLFFSYFFGEGYVVATSTVGAYPQGFITAPQSTETGREAPSVDRIVQTVAAQGLHPQMYLAFPEGPTDPNVAYVGDASSPTTRSAVWVDRYSGEVLSATTWDQASALFKMSLLSYPLHVGSIYGLPTKIVAAVVCLLIVAMTITGFVMWWMRKPDGKTGFPRKPGERKFPAWLGVTIAVLGVLVPTVGLTILLLLMWDALLLARRRLFARS